MHGRSINPGFSFDNLPARLAQILIDLNIVLASFFIAYLIRFEGNIPASFLDQLLIVGPLLAVARLLAHVGLGVYRVVWRYVGIREAVMFARSVVAVSVPLLGLRLFMPAESVSKVPISVIVLEATFTFLGMSVSRLVWRLIHERAKAREAQETTPQTSTLLVGAGQNGLAIAKEALKHPSLGMNVRGFLDDDRTKTGMEVHGLRVIGTLEQVEIALQRSQAKQLIITTTAIPPKAILSLMDRCRSLGVKVRIVPALFEILGSKSQAEALREVQIEDLLSRDPISPSMSVADLRALYSGKRIMVTGAGGSIGAELCRQLALIEPEKLLLLERDENNLFEVHRELTRGRLDDLCVPILADITDTKEIDRVFREHRPQIVFHAAAFKHVPMMERFPAAAVRNNVFGTKNLVDASERRGVESFLMISTDKAVNPQSVMGATKRLAEIVVQSAAASSKARFACVRFGNVLGSRGSVVPIFRDQIARGGPVTVTHPEATRYFMTIPEAANLVLQAATKGKAGEIYLLDMGKPVRIIDLARQMIHLSGASEDVIPIQITGTRPGEKLFEELRADSEELSATTLRKVLRVKPQAFDAGGISEVLQRMDFAVRAQDHEGVRVVLRDLGIGYGVPSTATVAEPVPPRLPM